MHTKNVFGLLPGLLKPSKFSEIKALVSCLVLSGRKLKNMTESLSFILAFAESLTFRQHGSIN